MSNFLRFLRCFPFALILVLAIRGPASAASPEDFVKDEKSSPGQQPAGKGAKKGAKPGAKSVMDTAKIHEQYLEGEFDAAIRSLEAQLRSRAPMSHAESVFVYKHLGVMYAASQATRE